MREPWQLIISGQSSPKSHTAIQIEKSVNAHKENVLCMLFSNFCKYSDSNFCKYSDANFTVK